jgi:hypothetical protein
MTNQTENQTESPTSQTPNEGNYGIDWLWILYVVLYSVLFAFISVNLAIPNGWAIFLLGIIALAALKYLIRFDG